MKLDTIPDFNFVKCSIEECMRYGEVVERNEIVNLNYIFKVAKQGEKITNSKYDAPCIWFYHTVCNPRERSYDVISWHYPNNQEGLKMRDRDYQSIINLCKNN